MTKCPGRVAWWVVRASLTLTIKMRVRKLDCEEELVDLLKRYRDALNHSVEKIVGEKATSLSRATRSSTESSRRLSTYHLG